MRSETGKGPARHRGSPGRLAMGRLPREPISGGQIETRTCCPLCLKDPGTSSRVPTPHYAKLAVPITGAGDRGPPRAGTLPGRRGQAGAPAAPWEDPAGGPAQRLPQARSLAAVLASAVQERVQGGPEVLAYLLLQRECGASGSGGRPGGGRAPWPRSLESLGIQARLREDSKKCQTQPLFSEPRRAARPRPPGAQARPAPAGQRRGHSRWLAS